MKIVLCGYMGSGKSLIGKRLAGKLKVSFVDLDDAIEAAEEMTIGKIFSTKGEIAFRKSEMQVLETLLQSSTDMVLSLGGGTPCYGRNLELIKETTDAQAFYLKVGLDVLTDRLFKERSHRPIISAIESKAELNEFIRKHLFERQYYYLQCGQKIDTTNLSIDQIIETLVVATQKS